MRTLYRAERVTTFSQPASGEWVLVDGRHVERVGSGAPPTADRVVELPGSTIMPGFIDSHVHLTGTGMHHAHPEVSRAGSAGELLEVLRPIVSERTGVTLVHGFDESAWERPATPTIEQLDAVTREPLIVMRVDGHLALANSAALRESEALAEEGTELDGAGRPTGTVTRAANNRLKRWASRELAAHDIREFQLKAASIAAGRGVTCVHEMSLPFERGLRDLEVLLEHARSLPTDVVAYVGTTDVPQVMDLGLDAIGGDLPVDGSLGAYTAALAEPYADRTDELGARYYEDEELFEFFRAGHAAGLQVGVHAIGDAAIEQVIATWERLYAGLDSRQRRHFRARRHRVEHFELAGPVHVERAAMLGLAVSVQPSFDATWGGAGELYEQRLGTERARAMNPFRELVDRGVEVGVGSDSPITSLDPMAGLAAMEQHHQPTQRLSREEGLRLSTSGGAHLAHLEKKGALAPGMHADFAAYDVDLASEPDLVGVRPLLTVSLGREVFAR